MFVINGNLLDASEDVICHGCNAQGVMRSGVAKFLSEKWPNVYEEYKKLCDSVYALGMCQLVQIGGSKQYVANLISQGQFGYDGKRYTSYDAVCTGLESLLEQMVKLNLRSVALPCGMCSVRGGANWDIIQKMIEVIFRASGIEVTIYRLDRG
jgi:O-acetyl-ADP-ribose deacetylase (regulator of RNase III)